MIVCQLRPKVRGLDIYLKQLCFIKDIATKPINKLNNEEAFK